MKRHVFASMRVAARPLKTDKYAVFSGEELDRGERCGYINPRCHGGSEETPGGSAKTLP